MADTIETTKAVASSNTQAQVTQPKVAQQPKAKRILKAIEPVKPVVADKQQDGTKSQVQKYTKLLDDNNMLSVFTVKENEDATDESVCQVTFNYADCTRSELLELATSSARITLQSRIRKMSPEARKLYCSKAQLLNVKAEIVAAARQQRDPLATMISAFARARGITEVAARPMVEKLMEMKL